MRRFTPAVIPLSLLVAACGILPGAGAADTQAQGPDPESVEMATDEPGSGYQRLQKFNGYVKGECRSPRAGKLRAEALDSLRLQAAKGGADYVHVIGTCPLEERPSCGNEVYRISGVGYRLAGAGDDAADTGSRAGGQGQSGKASQGTNAPERGKSTAAKLRELEALREQDLISEAEYERLRERILDEAF